MIALNVYTFKTTNIMSWFSKRRKICEQINQDIDYKQRHKNNIRIHLKVARAVSIKVRYHHRNQCYTHIQEEQSACVI